MIYTIGHSTRPLEDFLRLLQAQEITRLADVRTVPGSRRHPQFAQAALSASLVEAGIAYRHFPRLGGLRKPRPDSRNTSWRNEGFRGYADYMETPAFDEGIDELLEWKSVVQPGFKDRGSTESAASRHVAPQHLGPGGRLVIMCAEAVWWRCHRQLIADALIARGVEVGHIMSLGPPTLHELTSFAHAANHRVRYRVLI